MCVWVCYINDMLYLVLYQQYLQQYPVYLFIYKSWRVIWNHSILIIEFASQERIYPLFEDILFDAKSSGWISYDTELFPFHSFNV